MNVMVGDANAVLSAMPTDSVDVAITSPPYEDCRTYGIDFKLKGQAWCDWLAPIIVECCRVTDGLVFVNMAAKVRQFRYSAAVEWLVADLTRLHGLVCGPSPYVFHRVGIPGSGSLHYHRRDWEPVYAFAKNESLPVKWSDNTAFGHPPKWAPGGQMSYRHADGRRKNASAGPKAHRRWGKPHTKRMPNGEMDDQHYVPPELANPGNVVSGQVGKGHMGSDFAHENEAPFPEWLVERFMLWFCPPGGTALDPFCGSGTTLAVAAKHNRKGIGIDARQSQVDLTNRRLETVQRQLI